MTQLLVKLNASYDRLSEPRRFLTAMSIVILPYWLLTYLVGAALGALWILLVISARIGFMYVNDE